MHVTVKKTTSNSWATGELPEPTFTERIASLPDSKEGWATLGAPGTKPWQKETDTCIYGQTENGGYYMVNKLAITRAKRV